MAVATATAILIGAGVAAASAGTTAYFAHENANAARDQRSSQEELEKHRRRELANEAAAREAAKAQAATSGQRVGTRSTFTSGLGFGSGNTAQGLGSGSLFGN